MSIEKVVSPRNVDEVTRAIRTASEASHTLAATLKTASEAFSRYVDHIVKENTPEPPQ